MIKTAFLHHITVYMNSDNIRRRIDFTENCDKAMCQQGPEKAQVGNEEEMAQSERKFHSKNRGGKKTKLTIRYLKFTLNC